MLSGFHIALDIVLYVLVSFTVGKHGNGSSSAIIFYHWHLEQLLVC